jgi:SAM-dependent methyltransferase
MTHPVEKFYRQRMEQAALDGSSENDYKALDQGPHGTGIRHAAVANNVKGLTGRIVDLGCGTGLFLEFLAKNHKKPAHYVGVDGFEERRVGVERRLIELEVPGAYINKPMGVPFEDLSYPDCDVMLMIGVMGFWGYHTERSVVRVYTMMRASSLHGCITFPKFYHPERMGVEYLRRWDMGDVIDLLALSQSNVVEMDREFCVVW